MITFYANQYQLSTYLLYCTVYWPTYVPEKQDLSQVFERFQYPRP